VGLLTGWTTFEDRTWRSVEGTVGGTRLRNLNAFPALAGVEQRLLGRGRNPRLALGLHGGVWWVQQHTDLGPADRTRAGWRAGVSPGLGLVIPTGPTAWILQVRYHHLFADSGAAALGWWTLGVGFGYR
jgi:hypothetical protein